MLDVDGDIRAMLADLHAHHPQQVAGALNRAWAGEATERLREYVGGGPMTTYLRARSGAARDNVRATWDLQGGTLSASGPGMNVLEEGTTILPGGVIRPKKGKWLTFRLREPADGVEATGPWVRVRQVRIKGRYMVRDAAAQALDTLPGYLDSILGGDLT